MIQHAAETTEGDCDTGHAKRVFIKLTNIGAYDMVADMRISPNSALKLFAAAAPPSRLLRFSQQQRKAAAEQPAGGCFFVRRAVRRPRISVGNEMSMADNLLQKTAKTARRAMRRPAHSAGLVHLYECV